MAKMTLVRLTDSKAPVLMVESCDSIEELFHRIDVTCDPYSCEYIDIDTEQMPKMQVQFGEDGDLTIECPNLSGWLLDLVEENSCGEWCEFPQMWLDDIELAEDFEGDIF